MSGHRYVQSTNPFYDDDDDDVDDETFLRNSTGSRGNGANTLDEQIQSLQQRRKEIEQRTVQSTERSIGILRDSEQIGIATAEELSLQREQLERTDKRLDEINQTLRFSQKHINGIKSVFSSLKNYVAGGRNDASPVASVGSTNSVKKSATEESLQPQYDRYESHPFTHMKGQSYEEQSNGPSGSKQISARLEENLSEMSNSISRLKGLAFNLSEEIDQQNDLIENITTKTETADMTISQQNKQMNRILGKK